MRNALLVIALAVATATAQTPPPPDASKLDEETLRHFQALVRIDTSDPPGNEQPAAEYLKKVLEAEGIPAEIFALEPHRPNVVARLKGSGKQRPLLIMGHTDVVNVDPKKWTHPPFSATRDGGYVYGRGTVDDKDNVVAGLMVMLMLKRQNVPLDRDVIFLAESGEEGSTRVGIQFMVGAAFPEDRRRVLPRRRRRACRAAGGQVKFASVQTLEKIPRAIELTARGIAGHGSVPLQSNAVVHLAAAVAKVGAWKPQIRLNDTTRAYFKRLASISSPADAKRYLDVIGADAAAAAAADDYFLEQRAAARVDAAHVGLADHHPGRLSHQRHPVGSQGDARRAHASRRGPGRRSSAEMKKVIDDPAVDVAWARARRASAVGHGAARLRGVQGHRGERHASTTRRVTLPTMSHRRDRHGVPAREGRAVFRHRAGDRRRGRTEGLRRAQRSGAHPRERALSLRPLPLRHRRGPGARAVGLT